MVLYNLSCKLLRTKDYSKLFLWGAKLNLDIACLWPGNKRRWKINLAFVLHFLGLTILISGEILYALKNSANFNKWTFALCMLLLPLMVLVKALFLWYKLEKFEPFLQKILTDFWPYDLTERKSKHTILKFNKYSNIFAALFISVATFYALILYVLPIFATGRTLPFDIAYPFDWVSSPFYEFLYFQQVFTFSFSMATINLGSNFLILGFLLSVSSQYSLLQDCLSMFNTDVMYDVNAKLRKYTGDHLEEKYDEKKEFFVRCVAHHRMLLSFTNKLNDILNPLEFCQLAFSCFAVCLGTLRLTSEVKMTALELIISCLYVTGIVMQLSIDCFLGTLLYYEASLLPDAIFESNWVTLEDKVLKHDIKFLLLHCQRIPQFNTYNLYDLHMMSFIKVLKLAFSLYTLLSSLGSN